MYDSVKKDSTVFDDYLGPIFCHFYWCWAASDSDYPPPTFIRLEIDIATEVSDRGFVNDPRQ